MEKNKLWTNELLMESLRAKSKSSKTISELAKSARINLLERRYNIDAVEKHTLQTALENLQNNIQIKSRSHFVEKLESITRQLELKFTDNGTNSMFISSDMFYLEILLDPQKSTDILKTSLISDVKVHHECSNESESNHHLVEVLRKGDFIDFTQQLAGYQSIYQLNAESKIKSKAFIAIQALETDLNNIFSIESVAHASSESMVLSSSIGLITPRRGGIPMSILFFVRPTELLNFEQKKMDSLTSALAKATSSAKKSIGNSVTINLEAAAPSNKLQIAPLLMKCGNSDGNFTYTQINPHNSTMLPAVFVLRLNRAMPMISEYLTEIKKITNNLGCFEVSSAGIKLENTSNETQAKASASIINLIVNHESQETYENGQKGLFVTLSDQSHCYFIPDNLELTGSIINSIQFTEPAHVSKIIKLLRKQAVFNALIASCVRIRNIRLDFDISSYMFEVNVVSHQLIQVFVEHPIKEKIVTMEFDLSDIKHLRCKVNGSDQHVDSKLENYIFRVFQKTLSIPCTLRSLLKYWEMEAHEFQRSKKRLFNTGFHGSVTDLRKDSEDKNDDSEKSNTSNSTFGSRSETHTFDICGINKSEFIMSANEENNEKRLLQNLNVISKSCDQLFNKLARSSSEIEDENKMASKCLNDNLFNESFFSSAGSEGFGQKGLAISSKQGQTEKSLDIFEFNDPSPPPPNAVMAPLQSPLMEERSRKISTPKASPSTSFGGIDKRMHDSELIPLKSQFEDSTMVGQSISITPTNSSNNFVYDKPKSEKKKKRKREESGRCSPSITKKKSSDSLVCSPSRKSSGSVQLVGKPSASFKSRKLPGGIESIDDLSFLNYSLDHQAPTVPTPLPSPQSLVKNTSSSHGCRKSSLTAVINKLKSDINDTLSPLSGEEKKGEYQIKPSGSDGIKITFNKTKSSKGSKSPKHTGLKKGVNSGPASKKTSQSITSSHKLLFQKSSSSGSLSSSVYTAPSPKSLSQPGKSSSKEKSKDSNISSFSSLVGSSTDMLKNMLNLTAPMPRTDIMKAFDRNFQIPKLSARAKSDDKQALDEVQPCNSLHPRSAPSTPIQSSTPSPTMDCIRESSGAGLYQPKIFGSSHHQNKYIENQTQNEKLFKSASSEQLYDDAEKASISVIRNSIDLSDNGFQGFLRTQSKVNESSTSLHKISANRINHQTRDISNVLRDDRIDGNVIGNET